MTGAEERSEHPEGEAFQSFFHDLMWKRTEAAIERQVLRNQKENLWNEWKKVMYEAS